MSLSYEEALSTLQSMFGETWSKESLDAVLRHFEGHMENTIEAILNHGRKEPEALIAKLKNSTSLDEDLARQLDAQEHQHQQRTSTTDSSATTKTGLGTPTRLPPEFLRIPGYSLPSTIAADEQLARMLQDEIFQRELANSREFGHLARNPSRTNYPGAAAAAAVTTTSEGPNIMEKLAEMGDQAKSRLTLWAAQLQAQSKKMFSDGSADSVQERTSLLTSNNNRTEEEVNFSSPSRSSRDYEMKSMDALGTSKKDK